MPDLSTLVCHLCVSRTVLGFHSAAPTDCAAAAVFEIKIYIPLYLFVWRISYTSRQEASDITIRDIRACSIMWITKNVRTVGQSSAGSSRRRVDILTARAAPAHKKSEYVCVRAERRKISKTKNGRVL